MRRRVLVVGILVVVVAGIAAVAAMAASFSGAKPEHWGVIERNTIGSPVAELRDGPFVNAPGTAGKPPYGNGSLGIEVANVPGSTEKVAFGNEVDFFGDNPIDINAIGYRVFQTGEDVGYGGSGNLPNITFEIDPNLTALPSTNYTSLVWNPGPTANTGNEDKWSPYIDATQVGYWYFTNGATATATGCGQSNSCSWSDIKTALGDGGAAPSVLSLAIAKGRDSQFQGAVDGLRVNNKQWDFEAQPDGVKERGL